MLSQTICDWSSLDCSNPSTRLPVYARIIHRYKAWNTQSASGVRAWQTIVVQVETNNRSLGWGTGQDPQLRLHFSSLGRIISVIYCDPSLWSHSKILIKFTSPQPSTKRWAWCYLTSRPKVALQEAHTALVLVEHYCSLSAVLCVINCVNHAL